MSIGLVGIYLINISLMLRFDSVGKMKTANQTMRLSKKMIRFHPNQMQFFLQFRFG